MSLVNLNMVIHNHQPVGNLHRVFEWAYDQCYRHIIDVLEAHPGISMSLHISGPLLDWLIDNKPKHIDQIIKLVKNGQIEVVGGAYYEPIASVLRTEDALGQILLMQNKWKDLCGVKPKGMWVAERVWEPSLPLILSDAEVEYVVLDDEHFFSAGINKKAPLTGYYTTDRQGKRVAVFPSDKGLRYRIPYQTPERTIDYIREIAKDSTEPLCITYGDDGEKFGVWPESYRSVIEEKWLDRFFSSLSSSQDVLRTTTLSESFETLPSNGLMYLPTASYSEMLEWAMPAESIIDYEKLKNHVTHNDDIKDLSKFVKGGFWDNFLVKYPESNHIHKRNIFLSQRISDAKKKIPAQSFDRVIHGLYKSQCNCAYWHGLFGGVYLAHLRHGLWENFIDSEKTLDEVLNSKHEVKKQDINMDGRDELYYSNPVYSVMVDPELYGSAIDIAYRPANFNILNTLARRKEAYHHKMKKMSERPESNGEVKSIHDADVYIQDDAFDGFAYDRYRRTSFIEHIVPIDTSLDDLKLQRYSEIIPAGQNPYSIKRVSKDSFTLKKDCMIKMNDIEIPLQMDKTYSFFNTNFEVDLGLFNGSPDYELEFMVLMESNINLLSPHDKERQVLIDGVKGGFDLASQGVAKTKKITFVDKYLSYNIHCSVDREAQLFRYPVETISVGEHGGEKVFQGTCFVWGIPVCIPPEEGISINFKMGFTSIKNI